MVYVVLFLLKNIFECHWNNPSVLKCFLQCADYFGVNSLFGTIELIRVGGKVNNDCLKLLKISWFLGPEERTAGRALTCLPCGWPRLDFCHPISPLSMLGVILEYRARSKSWTCGTKTNYNTNYDSNIPQIVTFYHAPLLTETTHAHEESFDQRQKQKLLNHFLILLICTYI